MYIHEIRIFYFAIAENRFLAIIDTRILYFCTVANTKKVCLYAAKCKG